ncbi:hypothetical protein IU474_32155 [Nocardia otitidiscaviarum]|uniref:hypothetical protein n=1 Tax=Nocardia otitidiscaviarum TaxID=1823 RepID=UPI00189455FB|nr:hypothetical protein [Nocardia otitidiscaviarum]MBF6241701.1 hypothetical protein [Nocardia otitidiscaviarum]
MDGGEGRAAAGLAGWRSGASGRCRAEWAARCWTGSSVAARVRGGTGSGGGGFAAPHGLGPKVGLVGAIRPGVGPAIDASSTVIGTGPGFLADIVPDTAFSAARAALPGTALDGLACIASGGLACVAWGGSARVAPADVALAGTIRAAQVPHRLAARAPAPLGRCARAATGVLRAGVGSLALWLLVGVRVGHALPLALAER